MAKITRMYEQADRARDGGFIYSWILEAPYRLRKQLEPLGFRWVRGRPGAYTTNEVEAARKLRTQLGITIGRNGTHAVIGAPGLLSQKPTF